MRRGYDVPVIHRFGRRRPLGDRDFGRIVKVFLSDLTNGRGHGGGKQCHLPFLGSLREDPVDIFREAHSQHFIGLVQNKALKIVEF